VVMYEGIPTYPDPSRFWKICERHRVTHFYTAPTALRALMVFGDAPVQAADLSSLQVLGSVGEPINEEAWRWYHRVVGGERCPVTDTWWQTETGGILIGALAGLSPLKPTFAGWPLPGVQAVLLNPEGQELLPTDPPTEQEGLLALRFPWPSILRSTWGDHERCRNTYFAPFPGYYFTGDGARRDTQGMYRIIGRVDDVINVSGHRLGTAEIENAINLHPQVVESAVVGYEHSIKGQGIYAFVILRSSLEGSEDLLIQALSDTVVREIGAIARPDRIQLVDGLPKTRSGKIMRRFLRKIAAGDTANLGDTTTLLDPSILEAIWAGRKG
ncbi:MAG: AMP-binding protein, partial [Bacteroidota bacterium]